MFHLALSFNEHAVFLLRKKSQNKEPKVQECDATEDEKRTTVWTIIKK